MFNEFQIIGHRGWMAKYPENTLLSFEKAKQAGANMIEFDVQLSKDNHLVIMHDETTKRVCNRDLKVSITNRNSLEELDVDGNPIPFLEQVFDKFKTDLNYCIELKTFKTTSIESKLTLAYYTVNEILKHSLRRNCVITSFDEPLLKACRSIGFSNIGLVSDKSIKEKKFKLNSLNHRAIKSEPSTPTFAWTVNDSRRMRTLIANKVDGIITDHVDKLVNILNGENNKCRNKIEKMNQ